MQVETLSIPDVKKITPRRFFDQRGYFTEVFKAERLADIGISGPWVQDNLSLSQPRFTVRGLHCQLPPFAQGKLVRCSRGAVWDVAVDIRVGSPTYGRWAAEILSAENGAQLWIPPGFLHGFCTLEPDCELLYKVTAPYDQKSERGVMWNDPALALPWPIEGAPVLSDKDQLLSSFDICARENWFRFEAPCLV